MEEFYNSTFNNENLALGEYEKCTFQNCVLLEADLNDFKFTDCIFENCNLSMAHIQNAAFKNVLFRNSKLLGLNFGACDTFLFAVRFENCLLNLASFFKLKMKGTHFVNCQMHEVDLVQTDLTQAVFNQCDLAMAKFDNTLLEKADLREAFNYSINPITNRMKKARFSRAGIAGLLDAYDIEIE